MKTKPLGAILLGLLLLLTAACGAIQDAVEQQIAETVVEQVAGEGAMATIESAGAAVQAELDRRDLDGDGNVSEEEAQIAANAPGASPLNPLRLVSGQLYEGQSNLLAPLFYQADVPVGGIVNLNVENKGTADLNLSLGNTPYGTNYPNVLTPGQSVDLTMFYGSDAVQLMISLVSLAETEYALSATITTQNDGNTGTDAGNANNPTTIELGSGYTGLYGGNDGEDYFTLRLQPNDILEVTLTSAAENSEAMVLYGELSDGVYYTLDNILPGNSQTLSLGSLGENIAKFGFYGGSAAQYSFDVAVRQADDNGTGADIGNTAATAGAISLGQTVSGISIQADYDCYQFTTSQDGILEAIITAPDAQAYETTATLELQDMAGSALTWDTTEHGFSKTVEYGTSDDRIPAGDYLVCVYTDSWYPLGQYEFVVNSR